MGPLIKVKKKVAVLIPLYRSVLEPYEEISLTQCNRVLSRYDRIFVSPEGLDVENLEEKYRIEMIERFPESFFRSTQTYNKLLLSREFYNRFRGYEFILIHQLDAFVFEDQLLEWCDKGLDYVGAPWLGKDWPETMMAMLWKPFWAHFPPYRYFFFKTENLVGNGGFSLRKVSSALRALKFLRKFTLGWETNEDVFWGIYAANVLPFYKVPDVKTAARFSLELMPRDGLEMNGEVLPFGCHAWEKRGIDFWRPYIESRGYSLGIE